MEKRLIESACRLGFEWGRSRDECIRLSWRSPKGKAILGVNLVRPIVINGTWWRSYFLP